MKENRALIGMAAVALVIGVIAYALASQSSFIMGHGMGQYMSGDYLINYQAKAVLASINTFFLIGLFSIYWRVYRETGLEFSLCLMIFSFALLLYALVSNPLLVSVAGFRASGLGPFAMLPDLFISVASFTLLYISR